MRNSLFYWAILPTGLLLSCSAGTKHYEATADSTSVSTASPDVLPLQDAGRKRMRSADFQCRVKNVYQVSEQVERLTLSMDGVVEESIQENTYHSYRELQYNSDSLKRVRMYTATSHLRLRLPVVYLDSVVYAISAMAEMVDARKLQDQDATLHYLANNLANNAVADKVAPTKNDKAIDLNAVNKAEQQEQINRMIANKNIDENVAYATIEVAMTQPEAADIQVVADGAALTRSGFGVSVKNALQKGARALSGFAIGLLTIWPLWLTAAVVYFVAGSRLRRLFAAKKTA